MLGKTVRLFVVGMILAATGCSSIPAKKDTPLASYTSLIVRPIDWHDTSLDKISGDEVKNFVSAQPRLANLFQNEFRKHIDKTGYFANVTYGNGAADANTLILEPRIASLDPGIRMVMPGTATYFGVLKNADGKIVAKYSAKRTVGRQVWTTMMGAIEDLAKELGEDAASGLPKATASGF